MKDYREQVIEEEKKQAKKEAVIDNEFSQLIKQKSEGVKSPIRATEKTLKKESEKKVPA